VTWTQIKPALNVARTDDRAEFAVIQRVGRPGYVGEGTEGDAGFRPGAVSIAPMTHTAAAPISPIDHDAEHPVLHSPVLV
jgi:hypothetical protein